MEGETLSEVLVVDSSVVVKWYVAEEFRSKALAIRDDYLKGSFRLAAPTLITYEVINALRYSAKNIKPSQLKEICESIARYGFDLYELKGEYAATTVDAALQNNITIYDACYVSLASHLDTLLYTADTKLMESLKDGYVERVRHLKDYKGKEGL
ncbi:MAG: type II toxin-antitoxin system VapC family toxin [Nitrososphaerales archaeon]